MDGNWSWILLIALPLGQAVYLLCLNLAPCSQALCPSRGLQTCVSPCSLCKRRRVPKLLKGWTFSPVYILSPEAYLLYLIFRTVSWVQMHVPASYYAFTCLLNPCWDVRAQLCSPFLQHGEVGPTWTETGLRTYVCKLTLTHIYLRFFISHTPVSSSVKWR